MQSVSCSIEGVSPKRLQGSKSAKRLSQLFEIHFVLGAGRTGQAEIVISPLPEISLVHVRLNHIASFIVNANHCVGERL
jgi:hypothetical protein